MGILSRLFRKSKEKPFEGNVAFIGLSFAGKTTILNRLRYDSFQPNTLRTMGLNVDNFEYKGVKFSAFDLGGQETFRSIWEPYLKTSVAVCYVIDSSTPEFYIESSEVLHSVIKLIPVKAALLLLANKSDLAPKNALAAIVTAFDLKKLQETADLKAINLFYISAKTGDQFNEAFDWLSDVVTNTLKKGSYKNRIDIDDATKLKIRKDTKLRQKDLMGPGGMRF